MIGSTRTIAIGLAALASVAVLAQLDAVAYAKYSTDGGTGKLLTDPDELTRGYYELVPDGVEIFYDPTMPTEHPTGVEFSSTTSSQYCTKSDAVANSDLCQSWSGSACNWVTVGRHWWEPDAFGKYHDSDYQSGRCSEVRVVNEEGTLKAYFRPAIRASSRTDANPPVTGTWSASWYLEWLKADDGLINDHPSYQPLRNLPAGSDCIPDARDVTLMLDFANCVWGASSFDPAANLTAWKERFPEDANLLIVKGFRLHGLLEHTTPSGVQSPPIEAILTCGGCLG